MLGHCLITIALDRFRDRAGYEGALERLAGAVHDAPRAEGVDPFMIPGEREARVAEERARSIPIDATTVGVARGLGRRLQRSVSGGRPHGPERDRRRT